MEFCSPFDEHLAQAGPAAVFLFDPEGALRFQPNWTRDAYGRAPGPHSSGWTWTVLRDRDTGFLFAALVTSPTLLQSHPRLDVKVVPSREAVRDLLTSHGTPPIAVSPW